MLLLPELHARYATDHGCKNYCATSHMQLHTLPGRYVSVTTKQFSNSELTTVHNYDALLMGALVYGLGASPTVCNINLISSSPGKFDFVITI